MTNYEFLKQNRQVIEYMLNSSILPQDVRHLDMYEDYKRLLSEGHKKDYVIAYLSETYNISVRNIYRIVKRLNY